MEQRERLAARSEMDQMFDGGDISKATPEQLERFLRVCCTGNIPNETVHPREIVRGLTINHVQMARTILRLEETMHRLNAANDQTQRLVVRLTWVAIIVGVVQAVAGVISIFR